VVLVILSLLAILTHDIPILGQQYVAIAGGASAIVRIMLGVWGRLVGVEGRLLIALEDVVSLQYRENAFEGTEMVNDEIA